MKIMIFVLSVGIAGLAVGQSATVTCENTFKKAKCTEGQQVYFSELQGRCKKTPCTRGDYINMVKEDLNAAQSF